MSETPETIVEEQPLPEVSEPVLEVVEPAPPVQPELHYTYQPTDGEGRNMGGPQVIKYKTQEELVTKLQEQNVLILRKLREETRKNRLGIVEPEQIEETAPRFASPVEFKKGSLTADQRIQMSRNILDPERFEEVADSLFEYAMGAKPEVVRNLMGDLQQKALNDKAKVEADAFVATTPEYVKCDSNFESITSWMVRYGLDPVRRNFRTAFDTLNAAGVLIVNPPAVVEQPVAVPEPVVAPVSVPVTPVQPPSATVPGLSSGLNRGQGVADAGPQRSAGDDIVYEVRDRAGNVVRKLTGLAAVNTMPGEEMKKRMRNPAFARAVDKILAEDAAKNNRQQPSILDR